MFTIFSADVTGNPGNCSYPNRHTITDEASLKAALCRDYVCAEYSDFYRSNDNFLGSNCLPVDCDNDHSEDPEDWIYPSDVADAFPNVAFAVHYSRHHMKVKNGKAARPKFHVLFAIDRITDAKEYSNLKKRVNSIYPYFDTKALDAARFFFGTKAPQLCSTDEIYAEKKYKDPFSYVPTHTLVLYTNHLPKVGALDAGTWRRLIVIPFNAVIDGSSDIKNYADYLYKKCGGAILTWIIEGAQRVIAKDYKIVKPRVVEDAIRRYKENNDWLSQFLEECCELGRAYQVKSGEFYNAYRNYCTQMGEYTRSTTDFYTAIEQAGYEKRKTKTGAFIFGLQLKSDFLDE